MSIPVLEFEQLKALNLLIEPEKNLHNLIWMILATPRNEEGK